MGSTTRYLLPYPEPPEPADVPGDMKELAERTDTVAHDLIFVPLDGRLGTVELTLTGVSNDGQGKLTMGALQVTRDAAVGGKLTVTGLGSKVKDLTVGDPGDSVQPNGNLTVYNNLLCYGGGATRVFTVGSASAGFFGKNTPQYSSTKMADYVSHLGNDNTRGAIVELWKAIMAFGLMTTAAAPPS